MKTSLKKFRNLLTLAAVIIGAFAAVMLGMNPGVAIVCVGLFQLSQLAMSKRQAMCYTTALTPEQLKEFTGIMESFKSYDGIFKEIGELAKSEGGFAAIKKLPELLKAEQKRTDELQGELKKINKQLLRAQSNNGVRYVRGTPMVSDDCALALSGMFIGCAVRQEKWSKALGDQDAALAKAAEYLGVTKTALTSSDIPLPTIYIPQVVELVWHYGQFRANATVFPLGAGTVNLPQLSAGEDVFAKIAASAAVGEKRVAATNVTFTAGKYGGIVRIPTEIEEDTFIALGQFVARYIARRFAALEDAWGFIGTSALYGGNGVGPYCAATNGGACLKQLGSGKTKPTDATLADFRALRGLVNAAVFANKPKYYLNPTMDALLATFNTSATVVPYVRRPDGTATLDGYEIVWVGAIQAYSASAAASAYLAFFGDLSYWYLGERGAPRVETSREVYFATDEIGIRAIERIDIEAMAPDAMSALQLAAS